MAAPLYTTSSGLLWHAGKILIVVAGLPARGKTHISRSLERYLRWNGVTTEVFSLGDYRRKTLGHAKALPADYFSHGAKSEETLKIRNSVRERCERDIHDFFEHAGQVAIYDANNGTKQSRRALYDRFHSVGYHVIFLESVCNNQEIVLANIRSVKISSPDYAQWDPDEAVKDYMKRIADHERHYEPVEEMDIPWIRLFNVGEKIQINKIQGYLQSRIVFFLMNIHNRQRFIYFARSGQSLIEHSYRADSDLSPSGWDYAKETKEFYDRAAAPTASRSRNRGPWSRFASTSGQLDLPPTQAAYSRIKVVEKSRLCEINPGVWDGLSPDDVRTRYPLEWEDFLRDPYGHRAPRAESYHDLCIRLEPILIELEDMKDDLLIISHASVIRCLLAYLVGLPAHEVPAVDIARGDLIEVQPSAYGVKTRMFHFWSGPGRKDGEVATQSMPDPTVGILTPPVSSPPRSVLHLDRTYRSRSSSQADLGDSLSMTHADHQDETHHGENHEENVSAPIDIPKPTSETQQAAILDLGLETPNASNTHGLSKSPSIPPRKVLLAANPAEPHPQQENSVAEPESPTEASKVLPKVEPSLGADEAGQVAAKIEAADTRPTFYENVVEGATKRKKTQGPTVISTLQ
ncbi:6-phosphofructo-2-kinase/fructose-2,6-bisphosphatase Short=6PF-2-K/Fru-2,6-P2ase; Short=AtF2KP; Short=PFK/FBPase; Includes: RecName: Full=6-phosphofructo-2-kinase; Includes: RecName: Full=Fructose-2,6-bisphosphatase [Serendipita indica DSM 11827]|nr:6-phosphofructo-2-kinase/fructose-2,6-bisphosphatase Short=6PF-2-K/Fru-2,6-P2ase; Short=AtF2KP; Short=PFK/FBPase; Includes: RecName: Full=6-phosphofructo-2-kinase; Includes: RecName: Full=Fructose-2,6-bisphosphatase [Serendipita indica DSM 11827]